MDIIERESKLVVSARSFPLDTEELRRRAGERLQEESEEMETPEHSTLTHASRNHMGSETEGTSIGPAGIYARSSVYMLGLFV